MSRQKGSGAIRSIDAAKQDPFDIRRALHAGGKPIDDKHARLFVRWRGLCAQRDDCERRLKAGEGDKWTRKRFKRLEREVDEAWRALGNALRPMRDDKLSDTLAILSKVARPAIHGWQKEATRIIEGLRLAKGSSLAAQSKPSPNLELIEQRKSEQAEMTPAQREKRIRKRDAPLKAYEQHLKQKPLTQKEQAEQARKQRAHAAKFVPSPIPQTDKLLSLAKVDSQGQIVSGKVNITRHELFLYLRGQRYTMTMHDVGRFVRDRLKVQLRSERGKRTDLGETESER